MPEDRAEEAARRAEEAARRAEEDRRAALGAEYQEGLDRAGEAYLKEQARLAEERRAEANMTREREAWQLAREELAREEARAIANRIEATRTADPVQAAEQEAREHVEDRLEKAKEGRAQEEGIPTSRPPSWAQVQAAEATRRQSEEKSILEWQQKDREGLISRAGEAGWPQEELIEKLRSQAEIHAKQIEKMVREQQDRLERLRQTNGHIRDDRSRGR